MFLPMLQGCGDLEFGFAGEGANLPEMEGMDLAAKAVGGDERGIVVVRMAGPGDGECFIVERRDCYWSILGPVKLAS
jgi:hypothetical protein